MKNEVWKDVKGYEENYQVSNYGKIRSKDRYLRVCGGGYRFVKGIPIKTMTYTNGYIGVGLYKNGKHKMKLVHRLVAESFIPNPDNYPQINHKDENITNNHLENLEWCTAKYNANYGTRNERMIKDSSLKAVIMCSTDGLELKYFKSLGEASRETGFDISAIIRACKGKQKTSYGYIWKYAY